MKRGEQFNELVELFKRFPSIGQRQAERFAHFVTTADSHYAERLANTILAATKVTKRCPQCFMYHENTTTQCALCVREGANILIVVEKDIDVYAIESSLQENEKYYYFVLGGLIPIAGDISPKVRFKELLAYIEKSKPQEVIIAFSVHPDAEHTQNYTAEKIKERFPDTPLSFLGRGLSTGSELEYASSETLSNAFGRRTTQ